MIPEGQQPVANEEEDVHYVCQRCGNCCRWPGEVPVDDQEIREMAAHLGIPETVFVEQFTKLRLNRGGLTLIEKPDGACILLADGNHCRVNPVKPHQCRGFPNAWNFKGWRDLCEAIPVPKSEAPGN